MNRQIKFRGFDPEKKEWVYGVPHSTDDHSILHTDDGKSVTIFSETLGQYIGSTDANGTEIYEGDIFGDVMFPKATPLICEFRHGAFGYEYCGDFHTWGGNTNFTFNPFNKDSRFEIIGNIHDI